MIATAHVVRFWAKVDVRGPGDCWLWTASKDARGYGRFWTGQTAVRAHRFAYELLVGPIPSGRTLDHLCRNRACVNPRHLEPVTSRENTLRGEGFAARNASKDRCDRGHLFDEANTYLRPTGSRTCRECQRDRGREYQRRRREAA